MPTLEAQLASLIAAIGPDIKSLNTKFTSFKDFLVIALGDESTAITTGVKVTMRAPFAMTLTGVRASLKTASSSGIPDFDIKKNGVSIFTTRVTIDATEKTSTTAATAAAIGTTAVADDDELTFEVITAGTGAVGAKIVLYFTRNAS